MKTGAGQKAGGQPGHQPTERRLAGKNTLALTQDRGIDHIIETVGGEPETFPVCRCRSWADIGHWRAGRDRNFSAQKALLLKSPVIQGIGAGHRRALEDFVRAVDVTELKPVIEHRYRFDELEQALEHLDRGAFGKIVLTRE